MVTRTAPTVTALEAQGIANQFLSDHLPDRFLACRPELDSDRNVWRLPVVLTYAIIGPVGEVGEITLSASSEEIISHTAFDEMITRAQALYDQHRDAIEAPLP
jgi:hypothetical protein